jgi:hypothetical protein
MVHQTVYSEKAISVHLVHKVATLKVGDRTLMDKEVLAIASGSCQAGIDYDVRQPVIEVTGTKVAVRVPKPQLLRCGLNSVEFFDGQGLLPAPTELYNQLHSKAVDEVQAQGEKSDLVGTATDNALTQIELYLRRLGFEEVALEIDAR